MNIAVLDLATETAKLLAELGVDAAAIMAARFPSPRR